MENKAELMAQVEKEMLDDYCSAILVLLWKGREMRFNEILKTLKSKGTEISNPTLSAHLLHLRKKKWITKKIRGVQHVSYKLHKSIHVPSDDEAEKWLRDMLKTVNIPLLEPTPDDEIDIAISNILISKLEELAFRITIEPRIQNNSLSFSKSRSRIDENDLIDKCNKDKQYRKIILEKTRDIMSILRKKRDITANRIFDE